MTGDAPSFSSVHGPVFDIFVAACIRLRFRVQGVADLANGLDNVSWIWRSRPSGEEVMVFLAFGCLQMFKLWAVFKLGADGRGGGCIKQRGQRYPGNHAEL